jgi:hypothetical protein
MNRIEYWLQIQKMIVSRDVKAFPTYERGNPIELDGQHYYIDDIAWSVSTAKDSRVQGEAHYIRMIVRLDPV